MALFLASLNFFGIMKKNSSAGYFLKKISEPLYFILPVLRIINGFQKTGKFNF